MFWTERIAENIEKNHPDGEIIVSSGVSPSGAYHIGTLREVLTTDAIALQLKKNGRSVRHVHFVDDLDQLRKIPAGIDPSFDKYLGQSLCDVPSPDGGSGSYADYFLNDFLANLEELGIEMEVVRSHEKYRTGYFTKAIEKTLTEIDTVKKCIEGVAGRKLTDDWSPIQVNEEGYLKKRPFIGIDESSKSITYLDKNNNEAKIDYSSGSVKLDWRLDWPARWWIVGVDAEPFGRDHATKGGSYDTGVALVENVFNSTAPYPVPYEFINRAGETKKMSKSSGNTVNISDLLSVLPPEIIRFFVLRYSPDKKLFFDQTDGVVRLIDEYAELLAKPEKTSEDNILIFLCSQHIQKRTISNIPFSHLVASYQAALKDPEKTIEIIKRTEHADIASGQEEIIHSELKYIDEWLNQWAPDSVKFSLSDDVNPDNFNEIEKKFLDALANKIISAPTDADGEWFHKAIYEFKNETLSPNELFKTLYKCLIGKTAGPRAGWFLSILPREWLVKRLKLEV